MKNNLFLCFFLLISVYGFSQTNPEIAIIAKKITINNGTPYFISKKLVDINCSVENTLTKNEKDNLFKKLKIIEVGIQLEDSPKTLTSLIKSIKYDDGRKKYIFQVSIDEKKTYKVLFYVKILFRCNDCKKDSVININGNLQEFKYEEDTKSGVWPAVSHLNSQGIITGTLGEHRSFSNSGRLHNGIDIASDVGDELRSVYSIQDDKIMFINKKNNLTSYYNNYVQMESGIQYFHTEPMEGLKVGDFVKENQKFGFMTENYGGDWGIHVHIQKIADKGTILNDQRDDFFENFLNRGYGRNNFKFSYPRNVSFDSMAIFPSSEETLNVYREPSKNKKFWDVDSSMFPIIYGKVQIVSQIYLNRINSNGTSLGFGKIAPYSMGYKVRDSSGKILDNRNNLVFNHQFSGENAKRFYNIIHAKTSTANNPYFIISNKLKNGNAEKDFFLTDQMKDGKVDLFLVANGGTNQSNEVESKAFPVVLDNFKPYIQKIEIKDANNKTRYFAEWSQLTKPGDGSVILLSQNNDPFNSGTKTKMIVYVSEKIPSLNLKVTGLSSTREFVTADNGMGKIWQSDVVLPSSPGPTDLTLIFSSNKNILFGFKENVDYADVKRDVLGKFKDNGEDKFHKIKICPDNKDFIIKIKPDSDYKNINVSAQGGIPPYVYHIQEVSQKIKGRILYTDVNVFPVIEEKNYLIRVKDKEGCQAEEYYTIPKVDCDAIKNSGGQGTTTNQINLGSRSGDVTVLWDFFPNPDQISIKYRGNEIFNSGGLVSGKGSHVFKHIVEKGKSNLATIQIYAPNSGTAWEYVVKCPGSTPQSVPVSPDFEEGEIELESKITLSSDQEKVIIEAINQIPKNEIYFYYRELGTPDWNAAGLISLPYEFKFGSKEFEFKLEKANLSQLDRNMIIIPNPSSGPIDIHFTTDKLGEVSWSVYDVLGKEVLKRKEQVQKGLNIIHWNPGNAVFGVYFIKVQQGDRAFIKKMLFQQK